MSSKLCFLVAIVFGTAVEAGSVSNRTDVAIGKSGKTLVMFWNSGDKTCLVSNITEFSRDADEEKLDTIIADLNTMSFRLTGQQFPLDLLPDRAKAKCQHSTMWAVKRFHTGKSRFRRGASAVPCCPVCYGSCVCCIALI